MPNLFEQGEIRMTEEDIIRMAHEVFDVQTDSRERTTFSGDSYAIEAFATLVASAEREACANMCEEYFERVMASRIRTRGDKNE